MRLLKATLWKGKCLPSPCRLSAGCPPAFLWPEVDSAAKPSGIITPEGHHHIQSALHTKGAEGRLNPSLPGQAQPVLNRNSHTAASKCCQAANEQEKKTKNKTHTIVFSHAGIQQWHGSISYELCWSGLTACLPYQNFQAAISGTAFTKLQH